MCQCKHDIPDEELVKIKGCPICGEVEEDPRAA